MSHELDLVGGMSTPRTKQFLEEIYAILERIVAARWYIENLSYIEMAEKVAGIETKRT
jgi:hypothetical protein